jgi:hypothetical protein
MAGVSFIDAPLYNANRDQWREIITESGYFFTVSAMKWFGCRIAWDTLTEYRGGFAFITSERDSGGAWDYARRYTVRVWDRDNGTDKLSEFGEFATLTAAKKHLNNLTDN